jgi:hypothetical protein
MIGGDVPLGPRTRSVNVSAPETFDLGIGSDVRACLFDLDGVLTRTAMVHAAA